MEKTTIAIVGLVALVAALLVFSSGVYAAGGQFMNQGTRSGMMQGSGYGGSMMGGRAGYTGGMMGGSYGMMGGRGTMMGGYSGQMTGNWNGSQCYEYMQQYYNSTFP